MDNNSFYVYVYTDPRKQGIFNYGKYTFNYEPFYVGKGKNKRYLQHLNEKRITNSYKTNKINKIKENGYNLQDYIVFVETNIDEKTAFLLETTLIKLIGRKSEKTGCLLNITEGGAGGKTISSEESSYYSKLKWSSNPELKIRYSQFFKKMWNNTEKRNSILEKRKDLFTPERRSIISNNTTGESNPNAKLTEKNVLEILALMSEGWLAEHIEKEFNINKKYIYEIKTGKSWKYLLDLYPDIYWKIHMFDNLRYSLNPIQIDRIFYLSSLGYSTRKIDNITGINYKTVGRTLQGSAPYLLKLKERKDG